MEGWGRGRGREEQRQRQRVDVREEGRASLNTAKASGVKSSSCSLAFLSGSSCRSEAMEHQLTLFFSRVTTGLVTPCCTCSSLMKLLACFLRVCDFCREAQTKCRFLISLSESSQLWAVSQTGSKYFKSVTYPKCLMGKWLQGVLLGLVYSVGMKLVLPESILETSVTCTFVKTGKSDYSNDLKLLESYFIACKFPLLVGRDFLLTKLMLDDFVLFLWLSTIFL